MKSGSIFKIALFVYIFLEVLISFKIASKIGFLFSFLEIILSAMIGFSIFLTTPHKIGESLQRLAEKKIGLLAFKYSSILRIFGTIFIILPGFLGDIIGICLILFSTISLFLKDNFDKSSNKKRSKNYKNEEIIDVEIIDSNSSL